MCSDMRIRIHVDAPKIEKLERGVVSVVLIRLLYHHSIYLVLKCAVSEVYVGEVPVGSEHPIATQTMPLPQKSDKPRVCAF